MASFLPAAGILPVTKVRTRNENKVVRTAPMEAAPMEAVLMQAASKRSEFMR
ncbi:hypothetical protein [Lysobacter capsici]|uniref:hypothetical protein n=1 Tax=Lysobacter capsici TaxID=435897 RepID=UPI00398D0BB4